MRPTLLPSLSVIVPNGIFCDGPTRRRPTLGTWTMASLETGPVSERHLVD
jgi:hypothetical protein